MFQVPSQSHNGTYVVDEEVKMCECPVGSTGALCKHQLWVSMKLDLPLIDARSVDVRKKLYIIATGRLRYMFVYSVQKLLIKNKSN